MTRAYSEFMKGEIAKVKAANPDATPTEVFKTAANHWKQHCRDGPRRLALSCKLWDFYKKNIFFI